MVIPMTDTAGEDRAQQRVGPDLFIEAIYDARDQCVIDPGVERQATLRTAGAQGEMTSFGRTPFHESDSLNRYVECRLSEVADEINISYTYLMQLSLHTDYALRILMALAAGDQQLSVDWIAQHYGISRNHLAKVAQGLQAEGLIITYRGRGGGMRLAKPAEQINVGDVVRRFESLDAFISCMPGGNGCAINGVCGLKGALYKAIGAFLAELDSYTLDNIIAQPKRLMKRLVEEAEPTAS
jgi:Rrf2 family nitric oxide-sensitive transcriptional repressor